MASNSQIKALCKYIQNQEDHHKKTRFREEYVKTLKKYNVAFDDSYLFEELLKIFLPSMRDSEKGSPFIRDKNPKFNSGKRLNIR